MRKIFRRRATAALAAALGLALALSACSPPHAEVPSPAQVEKKLPDDTVTQLQAAVTDAMAATGASGAVVGVWAPWSGTWVAGLGTQTPGGAVVTRDMLFRAARETRPMTCDVLYDVAAAGLVSLDDSVSEWVSGVPDLTHVTLGSLCDGTSGIGSYGPILRPLWLANPARQWDPRELAVYGLGQLKDDAKPGTAYIDSDSGYVLLGLALERATGRSASALFAQYVAGPLGLESTVLPSPSATGIGDTAPVLKGHHSLPDADGVMNCTEPLDITELSASVGYTDSGVVTNIDDLGLYARALATGALEPDGVDRFKDPLPAGAKAPAWYTAKGGALQAGSLIGQYGAVPGYLVSAWSDPASGLTVAVVLNNSAANATVVRDLAWELAAIASKSPAASGETMPEAGLPWTAEQFHESIAKAAVCPLP